MTLLFVSLCGYADLEFNPEEFILVSASADKTLRFWDVQEFALIGLTPTDNATVCALYVFIYVDGAIILSTVCCCAL